MKDQPATPSQKTVDSNTARQEPRRTVESELKPGEVPLKKDGQPVTRKKAS